MRKSILTLFIPIAAICAAYGNSLNNTSPAPQGDLNQARQFLHHQQMAFEENKGQVTGEDAEKVKFIYKDKGLSIFLLNNGIAYQFSKTHYPEGYAQFDQLAKPEEREKMEALRKGIRTETYRMDISLVGANPHPQISTEGKSEDYTQYYNHDALGVHHYSKVTYHNVYPHIDWVIYSKNGGVKYDFVIHPGGNPAQIKLQTRWVEDLKLNADGSLSLHNRMGSITEQQPISFQGNKTINTQFNLVNNQITFTVDPYDPNQTLIIDPTLLWATYYGGGDWDFGRSCAVDGEGNVYLTGWTESATSIASGGFQNTFGGVEDAFLVKFNSSGVRQWATYYGGADTDGGLSCAINLSGDIYMGGYTASSSGIALSGHQNTYGGGSVDGFLVKFNSSGVRLWATYYGGTGFDEGSACAVDAADNVYLAGGTVSDLPNSAIAFGGHQTSGNGGSDGFLVKFNSSGVRQWGTYYGGDASDVASSCALDASGNVFIAGTTSSSNAIAFGGHQNTWGGSSANGDAFLVKFNANGVRQWATYYGASPIELDISCATDQTGNVYMAGRTASLTSIASGGHQNTYGGGSFDAFLVKFNETGVRQWGTYYGGSLFDGAISCAVDGSGNVYLVGGSSSSSAIATEDYQNTFNGTGDLYFVKFNSSGLRQWGSYSAGIESESAWGCAVDDLGNFYVTGQVLSGSSVLPGGHQNTFGGGSFDGFLAKFNDEPACPPTISITANQSGAVCEGTSLEFTATITNGGTNPTYQWQRNGTNVGSNSSTYTSSDNTDGDVITCILTSNATCASPATVTSAEITLTVNPTLVPSISLSADNSTVCAGSSITFNATTTNEGTNPTFQWQRNGSNVGSNSSTYTSSDNANGDVITCILTSNATCVSPAQVTSAGITLTVNPTLVPSISLSADNSTVCAGSNITFNATITNGGTNPTYQWQRNGSNVGSNSSTYTSSDNADGDVITCILTSNATCASPEQVTSAGIPLTVNPTLVPSIGLSANNSTVCAGSSISFSATITNGGTNPTYQWQRNGSNVGSNSSTYTSSDNADGDVITCILTSNATCASPEQVTSAGINVTINPLPEVSIAINGSNLETNEGFDSYTWSLNGVEIAGATGSIFEPTEDGVYEVEVTDANGCINTASLNFTIISTNEQSTLNSIALYPNPSNGNFTITFGDSAPRDLQVFDGFGRLVFQTKVNNAQEQFNLQGLARGVYQVRISEGERFLVKSLLVLN